MREPEEFDKKEEDYIFIVNLSKGLGYRLCLV